MSVNVANAVTAYARQAKSLAGEGADPRSADPGGSFADLVSNSVKSSIETGRQSEVLSAKAVAGTAELNDVIIAVTNAEVTLQTALAIRDRMIQAYQEIVRMPI